MRQALLLVIGMICLLGCQPASQEQADSAPQVAPAAPQTNPAPVAPEPPFVPTDINRLVLQPITTDYDHVSTTTIDPALADIADAINATDKPCGGCPSGTSCDTVTGECIADRAPLPTKPQMPTTRPEQRASRDDPARVPVDTSDDTHALTAFGRRQSTVTAYVQETLQGISKQTLQAMDESPRDAQVTLIATRTTHPGEIAIFHKVPGATEFTRESWPMVMSPACASSPTLVYDVPEHRFVLICIATNGRLQVRGGVASRNNDGGYQTEWGGQYELGTRKFDPLTTPKAVFAPTNGAIYIFARRISGHIAGMVRYTDTPWSTMTDSDFRIMGTLLTHRGYPITATLDHTGREVWVGARRERSAKDPWFLPYNTIYWRILPYFLGYNETEWGKTIGTLGGIAQVAAGQTEWYSARVSPAFARMGDTWNMLIGERFKTEGPHYYPQDYPDKRLAGSPLLYDFIHDWPWGVDKYLACAGVGTIAKVQLFPTGEQDLTDPKEVYLQGGCSSPRWYNFGHLGAVWNPTLGESVIFFAANRRKHLSASDASRDPNSYKNLHTGVLSVLEMQSSGNQRATMHLTPVTMRVGGNPVATFDAADPQTGFFHIAFRSGTTLYVRSWNEKSGWGTKHPHNPATIKLAGIGRYTTGPTQISDDTLQVVGQPAIVYLGEIDGKFVDPPHGTLGTIQSH